MKTPIIDTHQHLWDLDLIPLEWVNDIPELNRSFLISDYAAATQLGEVAEIEKSIYMEVDVPESLIRKEIDLVLELCRQPDNRTFAMIAATRPGTALFSELLEFAKSEPRIVGFRRVLHTDDCGYGHCLSQEFIDDIRKLGHAGKTFDLCIRREELAHVVSLATLCPETQFVLDHCGNADVRIDQDSFEKWKVDMAAISRCENVNCKVSGFVWTIQNNDWTYEQSILPVLEHVVPLFGEDRVLFGGDWPVCTLSAVRFPEWIQSIKRYTESMGGELESKLFSQNARRIYGIE